MPSAVLKKKYDYRMIKVTYICKKMGGWVGTEMIVWMICDKKQVFECISKLTIQSVQWYIKQLAVRGGSYFVYV